VAIRVSPNEIQTTLASKASEDASRLKEPGQAIRGNGLVLVRAEAIFSLAVTLGRRLPKRSVSPPCSGGP
jgi:hypothetical protein